MAKEKNEGKSSAFSFEIKENIEILSTSNRTGWNRELNIVSWNGNKPKFDIRDWSPDHSKMGKGISMTADELNLLKEVLSELDPFVLDDMQ